jgi:hypothetical protein
MSANQFGLTRAWPGGLNLLTQRTVPGLQHPRTRSYAETEWLLVTQSLFRNLFGEAFAGDSDHGPADHGFVVGGESFVVADAASVSGDPGKCAFHDPASG